MTVQGPTIHEATAYLIVRGAASAIPFYASAFGAEEVTRMADSDGRIGHAELRIGGGRVYLADEFPDVEHIVGPATLGGTSVIIDLEVADVEAVFDRAIAAGATPVRRPDRTEVGVQSAKVLDPFGHVWLITHSARSDEPPDG
jgi:PhnB protein